MCMPSGRAELDREERAPLTSSSTSLQLCVGVKCLLHSGRLGMRFERTFATGETLALVLHISFEGKLALDDTLEASCQHGGRSVAVIPPHWILAVDFIYWHSWLMATVDTLYVSCASSGQDVGNLLVKTEMIPRKYPWKGSDNAEWQQGGDFGSKCHLHAVPSPQPIS